MGEMINEEFDLLWKKNDIKGWNQQEQEKTQSSPQPQHQQNGNAASHDTSSLSNSSYGALSSVNDDQSVYCIPCQKRFAKASSYQTHLPGKKHIKALAEYNARVTPEKVARAEFTLQQWANVLEPQIANTIKYAQTRLLQTYDEAEKERAMETRRIQDALRRHTGDISNINDERNNHHNNNNNTPNTNDNNTDDDTYDNPLQLPLSWDGKPIPHWLYILHGLQQTFKCEVCGNIEYRGPQAYQRHFTEFRHLYGLKCLGIDTTSNTLIQMKPFMYVNHIKDVLALNEKLKMQMNFSGNNNMNINGNNDDEEMEDEQGNVYSKKVYEDLKRQGLI